jgi:hypothetical protein
MKFPIHPALLACLALVVMTSATPLPEPRELESQFEAREYDDHLNGLIARTIEDDSLVERKFKIGKLFKSLSPF